jgi:hypothetical protein
MGVHNACCYFSIPSFTRSEINPLELYVPPALAVNNCVFCIHGSYTICSVNRNYFRNQIVFVVVSGWAFFTVRSEFLNII